MRILQLAQFYPPTIGGEERHVRTLAVELARRGHEVHVGTLRLDGDAARPNDDGVTLHELDHVGIRLRAGFQDPTRPYALPFTDPFLAASLRRLTSDLAPDVVHAHNWIVNSELGDAHRSDHPLVLSLHDYSHVCATKRMMRDGEPCPGAGAACLPCSSRHYDPVRGPLLAAAVTLGRPRRRRLASFTPVSRHVARANRLPGAEPSAWSGPGWQVVPNMIPDDLAARADAAGRGHLPDGPYLFFAGDLSREKGLLTLLDAYARLNDIWPWDPPPLVCVGRRTPDTPTTDPPGVIIHDGWAHDLVLAGFRHATMALVPSQWHDPCPTTVLEALACGCPLVTTPMGGISDMVKDRVSAVVVPPADAEALVRGIGELLTDHSLLTRLRDAGPQAARPFTAPVVVDRLEALYAGLHAGVPT